MGTFQRKKPPKYLMERKKQCWKRRLFKSSKITELSLQPSILRIPPAPHVGNYILTYIITSSHGRCLRDGKAMKAPMTSAVDAENLRKLSRWVPVHDNNVGRRATTALNYDIYDSSRRQQGKSSILASSFKMTTSNPLNFPKIEKNDYIPKKTPFWEKGGATFISSKLSFYW